MSALSISTRRVLGGAAISAVLLGAGTGMAFAGDVDNTGAGSPVFGDQTNNGLAGDGGDGGAGTSGDATGEDGGSAAEGGAGGDGGSIGANSPTQNNSNQQNITASDQTVAIEGDGNEVGQSVESNAAFGSNQQGAGSTAGIMDSGSDSHPAGHESSKKASDCGCDASTSYHESEGFNKASHEDSHEDSHEGSDEGSDESSHEVSYESSAGDNTPVGAADTGDGSFVNAGFGEEVAVGGAVTAAALLAAFGVTVARRRQAAHAGL